MGREGKGRERNGTEGKGTEGKGTEGKGRERRCRLCDSVNRVGNVVGCLECIEDLGANSQSPKPAIELSQWSGLSLIINHHKNT